MEPSYYNKVSQYYNDDAAHFEQRYGANALLKQIRESFRDESRPYLGKRILEIGYGPGFDLAFYAQTCPEAFMFAVNLIIQYYSIIFDGVLSKPPPLRHLLQGKR